MKIPRHKKEAVAPRRRNVSQIKETPSSTFMRNRTITGSSSHDVRVTSEDVAHLKSPRVHVHHLARRRRRVMVLLAMVLCVALMLYVIISQFTAKVSIVIADMPTATIQSAYDHTVQDYLVRHPLERLRFATNQAALTDYVQQAHPEVASLTVEPSSNFATGNVVLRMRHPITGWTTGGKQEYVDEDGIAFSHNYFAPPSLQIVDRSNIPVSSGEAIASNSFLGFVGMLLGDIHKQGLTVTKIEIPSGVTREVDLTLKGIHYRIKCSVDRSAGEQAEDIGRVVRYMKRNAISPSYIDVRIAGKAYYK